MPPCVLHDSPIKRDLIAFRMEINCSSEGDIIVTNFEHFLSFFIHSRISLMATFKCTHFLDFTPLFRYLLRVSF